MSNRFTKIYALPQLAADAFCVSGQAGNLSQVSDVFIVPNGVDIVFDWTDFDDWLGFIDNQEVGGARHIVVAGGITEVSEFASTLPRQRDKAIRQRAYTLQVQTIDLTDANYDLARWMQGNNKQFRFWYKTLGGRIFGSDNGIVPLSVNARIPLNTGRLDTESATFVFEFLSPTDALRNITVGLTGVGTIQDSLIVWGEDETAVWGEDETAIWGAN